MNGEKSRSTALRLANWIGALWFFGIYATVVIWVQYTVFMSMMYGVEEVRHTFEFYVAAIMVHIVVFEGTSIILIIPLVFFGMPVGLILESVVRGGGKWKGLMVSKHSWHAWGIQEWSKAINWPKTLCSYSWCATAKLIITIVVGIPLLIVGCIIRQIAFQIYLLKKINFGNHKVADSNEGCFWKWVFDFDKTFESFIEFDFEKIRRIRERSQKKAEIKRAREDMKMTLKYRKSVLRIERDVQEATREQKKWALPNIEDWRVAKALLVFLTFCLVTVPVFVATVCWKLICQIGNIIYSFVAGVVHIVLLLKKKACPVVTYVDE